MIKDQIPNDEEIKKNVEDFSNIIDILYDKKVNNKLKWHNIIESDDQTSVTSSSNKDFIDNSNKEVIKYKSKFSCEKSVITENEMETNFKDLSLKEKLINDKFDNGDKSKLKRNSDFEIMFNDFYTASKSKIENPFFKKLTKSDLDLGELNKYTKDNKNNLFSNDSIDFNVKDIKISDRNLEYKISPLLKQENDILNKETKVKRINLFQLDNNSHNSLFNNNHNQIYHSPEYNKLFKKTDLDSKKEPSCNLNVLLGRNKRFKSD